MSPEHSAGSARLWTEEGTHTQGVPLHRIVWNPQGAPLPNIFCLL